MLLRPRAMAAQLPIPSRSHAPAARRIWRRWTTRSRGRAAFAADFGGTLPSGTVTIPAGQTSTTLTINVAGDNTFEGNENFTISLSNPSANPQVVAAAASTTGTIQNDDPPPSTH